MAPLVRAAELHDHTPQDEAPAAVGPFDEGEAPTFVLGGGGNLGAAQAGMLYALVERGVRPAMIVGTSVGAINGALLSTRTDLLGVEEIARFWSDLRRKDVLGFDPATLVAGLLGRRDHLFNSSSFRRVLESFLGFRRLEDAPVSLAVVATALASGESVTLRSGDATTALLASSAIPRVLPPVRIDGNILIDGAAAADIPLREAISLGARNIYVLPTAPAQLVTLAQKSATNPFDERGETGMVRIVPPPDVYIPLGDLSHSRRLLEFGYEQARAWLNGEPALRLTPVFDSRHPRSRRRLPRNAAQPH